jgi:hypothetical protein
VFATALIAEAEHDDTIVAVNAAMLAVSTPEAVCAFLKERGKAVADSWLPNTPTDCAKYDLPDDYERSETEKLLKTFREPLELREIYTSSGNWPANPTGLCKRHCVVSSCQYNGSHR